jgi:hypothetical protein
VYNSYIEKETKMNVPEKFKEIAHAWVDGAIIESLPPWGNIGDWRVIDCPQWHETFMYRVVTSNKLDAKK